MKHKLKGRHVVQRAGSGYIVAYTTDYWYPIEGGAARVVMTIKQFNGRGSKSRAEKLLDKIQSRATGTGLPETVDNEFTLKGLMAEFDAAREDAEFDLDHPIFQMAEQIDTLSRDAARYRFLRNEDDWGEDSGTDCSAEGSRHLLQRLAIKHWNSRTTFVIRRSDQIL